MLNTAQALDTLFTQWQTYYAQQPEGFPTVKQDDQWPSVCEIDGRQVAGSPGSMVQWQPVKRDEPGDFSNIEHALEITLNADIKTFFSRYFSGEIDFTHAKGPVTLLQIWNDDDFANLQHNMIGHIMMKKQLKHPITLFFALTDQDEQIISLLNDSGEVWLESVGKLPHLKLADTLGEFLGDLQLPKK
jgi:SecY interacting protein Syd